MNTVPKVIQVLVGALAVWALPSNAVAGFYHSFLPQFSTPGRDGSHYGTTLEGGAANGGTIYRLTPAGTLQNASSFPRNYSSGTPNRNGSGPEGALGVGQDGGLYGTTRSGGVFGSGVLFKFDPGTRKRVFLHHLVGGGYYKGAVLPTRNGTIYAVVANGERVLRLFPDGRHDYLLSPAPGSYMPSLVETAHGDVVLTTAGRIWRLNDTGSFDPIANTAGYTHSLRALPDGAVVGLSGNTLFHLSADDQFSVLHSFDLPFEGTEPTSFFVAEDGSYLGTTWAGGLQSSGVVFRFVPGANEYTVLHHLPAPGVQGHGVMWLKEAFPLVLPPSQANRPPTARTDVVSSKLLTVPAGSPPGTAPQVRIKVMRNDKDADGDPLTITEVGVASHGTATFDPQTNTILYTAHSPLIANDEFRYSITDGKGGTATARVVIRTNPAGEYEGTLSTAPNPGTGDPGTAIGFLSAKVSATGSARVSIRVFDTEYRLTTRFNEMNQAAHVLARKDSIGKLDSVQLLLRPDGAGWFIDAIAAGNAYRASAVCLPVP